MLMLMLVWEQVSESVSLGVLMGVSMLYFYVCLCPSSVPSGQLIVTSIKWSHLKTQRLSKRKQLHMRVRSLLCASEDMRRGRRWKSDAMEIWGDQSHPLCSLPTPETRMCWNINPRFYISHWSGTMREKNKGPSKNYCVHRKKKLFF